MKRAEQNKKIWIKRLYLDRGIYDYGKIDSKKAKAVWKAEKESPNPNFKIVKPEWYILLWKTTIDFFSIKLVSNTLSNIFFIIIGFLIKWLLDKYIT